MNNTKFNTERGGRGQAVSSNGSGRFTTENGAGRGRGSTRGGGQFHAVAQSRLLDQRTVRKNNEDVNPKELTSWFKQCGTIEALNSLYDGQKDKDYFNFIHACVCFSQVINLFTTQEDAYKNITKKQVTVFIEKVFSYSHKFTGRTFANVANDAVKLLDFAQEATFVGANNAAKLACNVLCRVFEGFNQRKNLDDFEQQALANIANDAVKLLEYAQKTNFTDAQVDANLACTTLRSVFEEVDRRKKENNLDDFDSQALANIANDAVKLLEYAQKTKFKEAANLACTTLRSVFEEVNRRKKEKNIDNCDPQALANIANDAVKLLNHAQNTNFKEAANLACTTLCSVFQAVTQRKDLDGFGSQNLANIANDLVQAGYWNNETSELLDKIGELVCKRNFNQFKVQGICNLAWAFSIGKKQSLICDWLIKGLSLNEQQLSELITEHAQQLYMAFLRKALDEERWTKDNPDAFLRDYLKQELAQKILQKVVKESANINISQLQKDVGIELRKFLPQDYFLQAEYFIKPYPVDFAIFKDKRLIAIIEVNGPTHFMLNGKYNLIHEFKEQLLNDMGCANIINIDYIEWENESKDKKDLLEKKLNKLIDFKTPSSNHLMGTSPMKVEPPRDNPVKQKKGIKEPLSKNKGPKKALNQR